ncbi:unannotated protein [freshwater metagenome]|uniref:Unannotated protein n=1 Tax=freshwater metagenome TaxID=449393 RepID=A0A6J6D1K4_9ZZZZ
MAVVPITPTFPFEVKATALRTAGWITSTTGIDLPLVYLSLASRKTAAEAELQAITRTFTPSSTSLSITARASSRTSESGLGP